MPDRSLVVRLVGDERDLIRAYSRSEKATKDFGRTTDTTLGKADKRFKTLKTAGAGFAGGFIASEVVSNLRVFVDQASESERVLTQVRQGLKNTSQSWDEYGDTIDRAVTSQSRLGFDDEALLESFDKFNRAVGDVNKALDLNVIAMDVARGRNIDLQSAATLVTKAAAGQRGALTRLGIQVDKNAKSTDLLRILTEKYGGSAEAAANDASTAQQRLAVQIENVQESIGRLLLPTVGKLADELAGAAETTQKVIDNLHNLRSVKIPVINIPIGVLIPGSDSTAGKIIRRVFGEINPVTGRASPIGALRTIRQAGDLLPGGGGAGGGVGASVIKPGSLQTFQNPVNVTTTINLDGKKIAEVTKTYTQRDLRSNPRQKRGAGAGLPRGD